MEFLAPAMMLGALGVAVPIAIHLIGRRRARVVPFAAMDFLLGTNRRTARRFRLRELLLLIIRALVCLAIALALAKPYRSCKATGPVVERGPQAAVLVFDDSFVSGYQWDGAALIELQRTQAYSLIEQLGPEAEIAVVRASDGADTSAELSRDHLRQRDTIGALRPSARAADLSTALRRAHQLISGSSHLKRTIYVFSPLRAHAFPSDEPPWEAEEAPALVIFDPTDGAALDNLAITNITVEPDPSAGNYGIEAIAELANFGARDVQDLTVSLQIDGRVAASGVVSLRSGERQKKRFVAAIPSGQRGADVSFDIGSDALPIDNRRYFHAELRENVRVLLVNGEPRTVRHEDELFYLEAALRPGDRDDSGAIISRAQPEELTTVSLDDIDVVVLANVRALDPEKVTRINKWVQEGGGLLVALGDNVDGDAYNRTMQPLLPQQLKTLVDVSFGADEQERQARALRLTKWETDHPVFGVFAADAPGLREAMFSKIFLLGPTTRVDDRKVLARYTNGATAVVEGRSGDGRLILMTSTLDRDWNDLAIHPGYLPLAQQLVRYLGRKQRGGDARSILVGEDIVVRVEANDRRIEIRAPDGKQTVIEGERLHGRSVVRFGGTERPGFYKVMALDQSKSEVHRPDHDFTVNIDPHGSDLTPAPASAIPLGGTGTGNGNQPTPTRRVELWHAVAVALLMLLLLESVLVLR